MPRSKKALKSRTPQGTNRNTAIQARPGAARRVRGRRAVIIASWVRELGRGPEPAGSGTRSRPFPAPDLRSRGGGAGRAQRRPSLRVHDLGDGAGIVLLRLADVEKLFLLEKVGRGDCEVRVLSEQGL